MLSHSYGIGYPELLNTQTLSLTWYGRVEGVRDRSERWRGGLYEDLSQAWVGECQSCGGERFSGDAGMRLQAESGTSQQVCRIMNIIKTVFKDFNLIPIY